MRRIATTCALALLWLSAIGFAQNTQSDQSNSSSTQNSQATNTTGQNGQNQTMSGKVSNDRKTFTNGQTNKSYKVDNPDALKGHEGEQVGLLVAVDPDTNTSHIVQIEGQPGPQ